tara:strand:+ start:227 stop:625 length:399 start_codon:yes stop_codon:yes gene_type:complete
MERHDIAWHNSDIKDELAEYYEAKGFFNKWSELSDVTYTYTRTLWGGYKDVDRPLSRLKLFAGAFYMVPKYTLRWLFFRTAGRRVGAKCVVREVRNPAKVHKLHSIADMYGLDKECFEEECKKLLKQWFLLK